MTAHLEHVNYTVRNARETAAWMCDLFGWHIRWQGDSINDGYTVHVGTTDHYLAIYSPKQATEPTQDTYRVPGGLNHIAVTVDDIDAVEAEILAAGFKTESHANYEPGRRFYFYDSDGIEYEIVQYD